MQIVMVTMNLALLICGFIFMVFSTMDGTCLLQEHGVQSNYWSHSMFRGKKYGTQHPRIVSTERMVITQESYFALHLDTESPTAKPTLWILVHPEASPFTSSLHSSGQLHRRSIT